MPQQQGNKTKHKITPDLILDLYKHTKTMTGPEKQQTVDKIKKLVKYMGDEITVALNEINN